MVRNDDDDDDDDEGDDDEGDDGDDDGDDHDGDDHDGDDDDDDDDDGDDDDGGGGGGGDMILRWAILSCYHSSILTNPFLHLLRECDVLRAVQSHPDPEVTWNSAMPALTQ